MEMTIITMTIITEITTKIMKNKKEMNKTKKIRTMNKIKIMNKEVEKT